MTSTDIELDNGPRDGERERLCIVTRTVRPVTDLIRFVAGPNGEAVPDLKRKLPGRGVWVTATQDALGEAIKRKVFARGLKREVRLPADLLSRTEQLLLRAVLDALAIAGKAARVAVGFTKVERALLHDAVAVLLHAAEASSDGVNKLDGVLRHRSQGGPVAVSRILTSAQLDLALGRPNVIHAALLAGPLTDTFLARLRRLERFRTGDLGEKGQDRAGAAAPN
ncbi:MAG: RNA-binding protein [Xanthobacteraceae bacterium]|jgi:predicted RNA-binding protein YlxR (DUF448 family)